MRIVPYFTAVVVLALAGCNTLLHEAPQRITVRTPGVENAQCTLMTDKNQYNVITPRYVLVERSGLPMKVICEKTGYKTGSVMVKPYINGDKTFLNVANGFVPGSLYDLASNSTHEYPSVIVVKMEQPTRPAPELEKAYTLEEKADLLKAAQPVPVPEPAPDKDAADKSMSKSLRK